MSNRALVTGASGFVGGNLVDALARRGYRVTCLVRPSSNRQWIHRYRINYVEGDITQPESLLQAVRGVDYVFHLAGLTRAPDAETYEYVNARGTRHLLEACLERNPNIRRFVYCSSLAATGPSQEGIPLVEADPPHPISDYGRSKLQAEAILRGRSEVLPITIIRPPVVYGPRDRDVHMYFRLVYSGVFPILGSRDRRVSLIYVRDLVEGMIQAAESQEAEGELYFLTDGKPHSWEAISMRIAATLGRIPMRVHIPIALLRLVTLGSEAAAHLRGKTALLNRQKFQELMEPFWVCSCARAKQDFGFQPAYSLKLGIEETTNWYLKHGWL